jgi:hypothetical protein
MPRASHGNGRVAKLALRSSEATARLMWRAKGVHDGVVLGALRPDTVHRLDELYFDREDMYTDARHNQSGLFWWEQDAVDRLFPAGGRVVVTAAGGGREVVALRQAGFDAVGYEVNDDLRRAGCSLLEEAGEPPCLLPVGRDEFPSVDGRFDAGIVGWGGYMHIQGSAARVAFLSDFRRALNAGAPVLVSFAIRSGDGPYHRAVARVGSRLRRLRGLPGIELGDGLIPHYVHWFTRGELAREAERAGFELAEWSGQDYGHAVIRAGDL